MRRERALHGVRRACALRCSCGLQGSSLGVHLITNERPKGSSPILLRKRRKASLRDDRCQLNSVECATHEPRLHGSTLMLSELNTGWHDPREQAVPSSTAFVSVTLSVCAEIAKLDEIDQPSLFMSFIRCV